MTEQTNSIGVPLDQDEMEDPGSNLDSPDPLLGEAARSGALSTIGSKTDQQDRVKQGRTAMSDLRGQYASAAGQANEAYGAQRKTLQDATARLLAMQMGPSQQEQDYRTAAAWGTGEPGTGRINAGGINAAQANNLQAVREAELQKQQLLTQYGMQIPQTQLGAANQRMNQITQQMRIQQSDNNNAENKATSPVKLQDKYYQPDPNDPTKMIYHPEMAAADTQLIAERAAATAKAKLAAQASVTGLVTPEAIEIAFETGKAPAGYSKNPITLSQLWQGVHKMAVDKGVDPAAFYAQTQLTNSQGAVLKDFQDGATSKQIDGINTAVKHLEVLSPLVDALGNGDVTLLNKAKNYVSQNWTGGTAPTDFNGVKAFVSGEIAKATIPGGGGEREREDLAAQAGSAANPASLKSIMQKWKELLAGKTTSTSLRWQNATQGKFGTFEDRFLLPETKKALGIQQQQQVPVQRPGQQASSPLIPYYVALAKWQAGGQQGPKPVLPKQ